ncbi:MAG: hypothetical protein GX846_01610 [Deltaproteobacteria bacterium]|nr:hypothetical protein [Deltaproteobacteria bacterium]
MFKKTMLLPCFFFMFSIMLFGNTGAKECGRDCLEKYMNRYMEAMLNNDPSLDLFARDCKFTENGVRLPLGGEGLWVGMSGIGTYKFYVPDIEAQQVAFIGTVREGAAGKDGKSPLAAVAIRLKIVNDKITEAEQLVIRSDANSTGGDQVGMSFPPTGESVEKLGKPHELYFQVIPENKRASREEMIRLPITILQGCRKMTARVITHSVMTATGLKTAYPAQMCRCLQGRSALTQRHQRCIQPPGDARSSLSQVS